MKTDRNDTMRFLKEEGLIDDSEEELVAYGISQGKSMLLSLIVSFAVGAAMEMAPECLIFLLVLIPLRMFAGGYHADSRLKCGILSFLILTGSLLILKFIPFGAKTCLIAATASFLIILMLAPVENPVRLLDDVEKKVFRRRAAGICAFWCGIVWIGVLMGRARDVRCVVAAMAVVSGVVAGGKKQKY